MSNRFDELRALYPEYTGDYAPPWGLPVRADFDALSDRYGVRFPPSYVQYCTQHAAYLPADDPFRWANVKATSEDVYLSLEHTIKGARIMGVPAYLTPFWEDEGNFYCFDTRQPSEDGEFNVVFWDHEGHDVLPICTLPGFYEWLEKCLNDRR